MNNSEIHLSDEDEYEKDTFVQLAKVEGGRDLVDSIVEDTFTEAHAHVVDATIDLNNKESYVQMLEEKTKNNE